VAQIGAGENGRLTALPQQARYLRVSSLIP
jgi:hypothetical protein